VTINKAPILRTSLAIVLLLATAALLLACGPASEARGGERVEFQLHQESEPTPTPTATPALTPAEKYPKLDPVLQKVVGGFEAEEWTETGGHPKLPCTTASPSSWRSTRPPRP
jgi:hypothetical protein